MMTWTGITFPPGLKEGARIGVTAPSSGVPASLHPRLDLALRHLKARGYEYLEGKCLRDDRKSVSGTAKDRAADFLQLWEEESVDAIIPPWGGELLINLLRDLDYGRISRAKPKWILGFSDTSTLLFSLTVRTGIATAHGINLIDAVPQQTDPLSTRAFDVLSLKPGETIEQRSSEKYQVSFADYEKKIGAPFQLTHKTEWKSLFDDQPHQFSGRMMGGCLDTIRNLIGTPFGDLPGFMSKVGGSAILYLENSDSCPSEVCRTLWNMRLAGWFDHVSGVLMGRSAGQDAKKAEHLNYVEALKDVLAGIGVPVIYDADIGHLPPNMTILNGCSGTIEYAGGSGKLIQTLA